jgi:tetratricopeptide (TPR) repeat protein
MTPDDGHKDEEKAAWDLFEHGAFAEASTGFESILQVDPANEGALQGKTAALRKQQHYPEAATFLRHALRKRPHAPGLLAERVWLAADQRKYEEALHALDLLFRDSPPTAPLLAWRISFLRLLERHEEASTAAAEALRLFPDSPQLLVELAWVQFRRRQYAGAAATFARVLEIDPVHESAIQGQVATLRLRGLLRDAELSAESAVAKFPKNPGIRSELAWIRFANEDFESAAMVFREVLRLSPSDPYPQVNLAWALLQHHDDDSLIDADKYCRGALELNAGLSEAFGCLGVIAFRQGNLPEAESYLLRSIESDATRGHYADLGALYVHMGRFEDARQILEKGISIKPEEASLHLEMGNLHAQMEKPPKAIAEFRQAAVLDPDSPDFVRTLAITLLENGKTLEAESILRRAIRKMPERRRWKLHLALSQLLVKLFEDTGDSALLNEALKEVNAALKARPDEADPHFCEGVVRFRLDDFNAAVAAFRRCLEKDPAHVEAEINAKRVQTILREDKFRSRASLAASLVVGVVALCQLIALWVMHWANDKLVTSTMITVLVPICLGLLVVAVLLPSLTKLKLTGLEAELSEPKPKAVSTGPKGNIAFGRLSTP